MDLTILGPASAERQTAPARGVGGFRPSWRWWQLAVLTAVAVLDLFARDELAMGTRPGRDPLADVILDTGLNWRLMLFLILPIYLIWVVRDAGRLVGPLILIRAGSFHDWLRPAVRDGISKALPLLGCMIGVAIATGIGAAPTVSLADGFETVGGPWLQQLVTLATVCSVTLNLGLLGVLVVLGRLGLGTLGGVAVAALLFGNAVLSAGAPAAFAPLNLGYAIQPLAAFEQYGSPLLGLSIPTLVNIVLVVAAVWLLENRARGRVLLATPWVTFAAAAGLLALRLPLGAWDNAIGGLVGGFYGSGGSFPDYLFVALVTLAPVWLALSEAEAGYEKLPSELLRTGSTLRWFWRSVAASLLQYPLYLAGVLATSLVLIWLRFGSLPSPDPEFPVGLAALYYHFLVNGTLQGWCFLVAVQSARWAAGAPWGGLTALATLLAAGAVLPRQPWLPLADLGYGQLLDGRDVGAITAASTGWLIGLCAVAVVLVTRFSTPLLERNLSQ